MREIKLIHIKFISAIPDQENLIMILTQDGNYPFKLKHIKAERYNGTIKELKCICDKFPENGTVCPKKQKNNSHVQQVP